MMDLKTHLFIKQQLICKFTDYVFSCKSNRVFNSKLKPLYTAFVHSVKLSEYGIGIKIDKDPSTVEQNNYLSKTVNVYVVYDLDTWPTNPTNNFKFNNSLFGATNIVKNSDKEMYVYSGYGITWLLQIHGVLVITLLEMLKSLVLMTVYHHILTITKNNFLTLDVILALMEALDHQEKSLVLILLKIKQNFVLSFV